MFEVLVYLYENYWRPDACPEPKQLSRKLSAVGFESEEIQERFKGKTIFDNGTLTSIAIQKGEGQDYSSNPHKVDGMSGATLTGKGVNNMLKDHLECYQNYLKKKADANKQASL